MPVDIGLRDPVEIGLGGLPALPLPSSSLRKLSPLTVTGLRKLPFLCGVMSTLVAF